MTHELFRLSAVEVRKLIESGEVTVEDYASVSDPDNTQAMSRSNLLFTL